MMWNRTACGTVGKRHLANAICCHRLNAGQMTDYAALFAFAAAEWQPKTSSKWFHLKDYIDQNWNIQREQRAKAQDLQNHHETSSENVINRKKVRSP